MGTSNPSHSVVIALVAVFFFLCGLTTTLNDSAIPYLQDTLHFGYAGIMLIQLAFYFGYFSSSPLTVVILNRFHHKKTIATGVLVASLGCFTLALASQFTYYPSILLAFFLVGSGIACLQVSGNAYAMMLGDADKASSRLTLAQAFNSVGTVIAPLLGAWFILDDNAVISSASTNLRWPYLAIGTIWLAVTLLVLTMKLPKSSDLAASSACKANAVISGQRSGIAFGFFAILTYVGGEVAIGSFLVKFLQEPHIGGLSPVSAGKYAAIYWGGMMVGRFLGAFMMRRVQTASLLALHGLGGLLFVLIAATSSGTIAMIAILLVGFCNSIMFPSIFSLAMGRIGPSNNKAAGILTMGNIGGAIVPFIQGLIADHFGLHASFFLPLLCYVYIFAFAMSFARVPMRAEQTA